MNKSMLKKHKAINLAPDATEPSSVLHWIKFVGALIYNRLITAEQMFEVDNLKLEGGRPFVIPRNCAAVKNIELLLGPGYFRRSYRMSCDKFTILCQLLEPHMINQNHQKIARCPNGPIPHTTRVSAALHYCAGGSPYDIMLTHDMSHTSVFECVWCFVEAVNKCPDLAIAYPKSHEQQQAIAKGFRSKSKAGFDSCAGCIDGILIWTEKPSESECTWMKCGSSRFLCGRKGKFGFNMQGICDSRQRFLDLWILQPASSSDFLAYVRSSFYAVLCFYLK